MIWTWLIKTSVGQLVGVALGTALLSGLLYAGCQVRGCITHKAEVKAKSAEKILEVEREDQKIKEKVRNMDDDELADYLRRGGVHKNH